MVQPASKRLVTEGALADPTSTAGKQLSASTVARDVPQRVGLDWSLSDPGVLQFSPQFVPAGEAGEHTGLACVWNGTRYVIQQVYAKGNLGKILYRDVVFDLPGDNAYDSFVLRLPNGNLIAGWHTGDGGDLYIYRSTDGGASWQQRHIFDSGDPFVTRERFSEVMLLRVTSGNVGTGTNNRIVACWASIDPVPPKSRDTRVMTAYSNDEGATWSTPVVVTPASGSASCGLLDDNQRPWLYEDESGNLVLIYTRVAVTGTYATASLWHQPLNNVGAPQNPVAAPTKIVDAPLAKSNPSLTQGSKNGCSPAVVAGRDGFLHLIWSEADYGIGGNTGEIHSMTSDWDGPGWANHAVLTHRTDVPNGYGRVTPHRIGEVLELIHVRTRSSSATDFRSLALPNI